MVNVEITGKADRPFMLNDGRIFSEQAAELDIISRWTGTGSCACLLDGMWTFPGDCAILHYTII